MRKQFKEVLIMNKFVIGLCTLIELGCITGLAVIGLKRNNDCYKAECRAINAEFESMIKDVELGTKDLEIEKLKKELAELKGETEGA